ncbi:hypothetical protein [Streptomyces sp. VB1]|uniref:hypothetical protein n=1 Tax=Streptomyces sp. VB1 TaxID=2986803 RepID=UPI002242595A|nr:hypothetical protein [Streptomyces sp. VB1]UZI26639.1 hypothetical protein OH133_00075 [Streptomyces sp. VB1]
MVQLRRMLGVLREDAPARLPRPVRRSRGSRSCRRCWRGCAAAAGGGRDATGTVRALPQDTGATVYRIVQEA